MLVLLAAGCGSTSGASLFSAQNTGGTLGASAGGSVGTGGTTSLGTGGQTAAASGGTNGGGTSGNGGAIGGGANGAGGGANGAGGMGSGGVAGSSGSGGTGGSMSGDAGEGTGGTADDAVACDGVTCSVSSQEECCFDGTSPHCFSGDLGGKCSCSGLFCSTTVVDCDGPEDCPSGQLCCGNMGLTDSVFTRLSCAKNCSSGITNTETEICHPDGPPCTNGNTCSPDAALPTGYTDCGY